MYRYARTRTASTINFHDQYIDLCHQWNGQVAELLAKKLGGVASYSDTGFHVRNRNNSNQYINGRLTPATPMSRKSTVEFEGTVATKPVEGKTVAADAASVVQHILWILEDANLKVVW